MRRMLALLIVATWCSAIADAMEINIKPPGDDFTKAISNSMVLTCEVDVQSPGTVVAVQWLGKDGKPVTDNSRLRIYIEKESASNSKLYITNIEHKDAGRYTCQLMVGGVKRTEKSVRLAIFKDITFDNAPSPQNPKIFTNATIHCRVSAEPKAEVSWRFKNKKIEPDTRYTMDPNGLHIKNITRADDGEYMCRAEVKADGRYDERRITVAIHIPPTIKTHPQNQEGVQGSNLNLTCHGEGLPSPKYEFRKNNKNNWNQADNNRVTIDADLGRIEFRPLHRDDEGDYLCVAINDVGEDKSKATIKVLVPPEIYELKNITKTETEAAMLVCKSHGEPAPVMSFRKMGSSHDYNKTNENGRILMRPGIGKLELEFRRLFPSDTANYTCTSQNKAGHHSTTGTVIVNYKPRFGHEHPRKVYLWAGKTHNVTCNVHANPLPEIHWLRHGRELQNNDTYQIFTMPTHSNLQVRVKEADQSWIYGIYTCRAKNTLGEHRIDINFTQASVPQAPHAVRTKESSPNMLILEVEAPKNNGGKEIVGYRVEYNRRMLMDFAVGYTKSRVEINPNAPHRNLTVRGVKELVIENLKPSTLYTFKIHAKNDVGIGREINHTAMTEAIRAPYPVQIISPKTSREAYSYTLVWDSPKTGGRPIEKYTIKYRTLDSKSHGKKDEWRSVITITDIPETPVVEYVIDGLTPVTQYEVEIVAQTRLGSSQPVKFIFNTSEVGPETSRSRMLMPTPTVIAVVVGIILVIIIVVDVSCYFLSGCGLTMFICVRLCDRQPSETDVEKDKEAAEGGGGLNNAEDAAAAANSKSPSKQPESVKMVDEYEVEDVHEEPREEEPLIKDRHLGHTTTDSVNRACEDKNCDEEKQALFAPKDIEPRMDEVEEPEPELMAMEEIAEDDELQAEAMEDLEQPEEEEQQVEEVDPVPEERTADKVEYSKPDVEKDAAKTEPSVEETREPAVEEKDDTERLEPAETVEESEEPECDEELELHALPAPEDPILKMELPLERNTPEANEPEKVELPAKEEQPERQLSVADAEPIEELVETSPPVMQQLSIKAPWKNDDGAGDQESTGEFEQKPENESPEGKSSPEPVGDSGKDSPLQLEDSGKNSPDHNGDSGKNSPPLSTDPDDGLEQKSPESMLSPDVHTKDASDEETEIPVESQTSIVSETDC